MSQPASAESLFDDFALASERARTRAPRQCEEQSLGLAGGFVRIRVAGRQLAERILPSYAHLTLPRPPAEEPDLEIDLWDEEATGTPCPRKDLPDTPVFRWPVGQGHFMRADDDRFVGHDMEHSVNWLDRKRNRIVGWVAAAEKLTMFERGKPLHFLLSIWLRDRGVQIVHAGLVSRRGKGLLIAGAGGAGKTTTSLACLCAGFDYLGDDYIALEQMNGGAFRGHSLYGSSWVEPEHLKCFPSLVPHAQTGLPPPHDKHLLHLHDIYPDRLASRADIVALASPRRTGDEQSAYVKTTKGQALLHMAPTSMLQLFPRPGPQGMDKLAALVDHVPCFELALGSDIAGIADCVQKLFAEVVAG
ncbi:MAG: hypothetical protein KKI08_07500 [Armatimonadetes bacterium]|nr:hypothetical protein [Armatimonadota bacterium]